MANLSGFGGPVHDSWFYDRTELARKNHLKMRKLGIYPVLQGYSGMVPNNINEHFPDIDIILQGTWCSFERPTMLRTTSPVFKEFDSTPWVFCMLNNFGGRLGLHGHLDNLANFIPEAYNTCNAIASIGITPEASFNNPVLYDFLFESVWRDSYDFEIEAIKLSEWICDYAERRYGAVSENANEAWKILLDTVYKGELNMTGQGHPNLS